MSKIKNENFYKLEGWMFNELGLKYSALKVYAVIYAFSKDGVGEYTGSWSYLASCLGGVSRPTINNSLKMLVARDYIIREDKSVNGPKRPCYRVNPVVKKLNGDGKVFLVPMVKKSSSTGKKTSPNTDRYTEEFDTYVHNIVDFLNAKSGQKYKPTAELTRTLIAKRLEEGFTLDDFYVVINKKTLEWKGTDNEPYLRPSVLFGERFDENLNAPLNMSKMSKNVESTGTFETDDFFEKALRRSYRDYPKMDENISQEDVDEGTSPTAKT